MALGKHPRGRIVTIGDELLSGDTVDTNLAFLASRARSLGLEMGRAVTVRDREAEIADAVRCAAENAEVCLVCGGLGPTSDDVTTAALAHAAGVELELDDAELAVIGRKFERMGRRMAAVNTKQARRPVGARWLPNSLGSASGFELEMGRCAVFVMPGVPRELERMMTAEVEPVLRHRFALRERPRRIYRTLGMGESDLATRLQGPLDRARGWSAGLSAVFVHYRPAMPEVTVVVEAVPDERGRAATPAELAELDDTLREALRPALYGIGGASLPRRLVAALTRAGLRLGLAESCTGGGTAAMIAAIPGASAVLDGAIVAYENRVKKALLGVSERDIEEHGAVSEVVALAMASGARQALGSDLAASITGIAGPGGGTAEKPVGTVHIAVSDGQTMVHEVLRLRPDRPTIQRAAALWAQKLVWDRLEQRGLAAIEVLD
jgi:nicotinamide-nucleotide amidase